MDGWTLPVAILAAWLAVGAAVGWRLDRAGAPAATAASALVAWPALLPLLGAPAPAGSGPFAARIRDAFAGLARTLADPAAAEVPWDDDLVALRASLVAADGRVALVDRLLDEARGEGAVADDLVALRAARDHAATEIEAVLAGVVQLRLQVGLLALEGSDMPVRARLEELRARAAALSEVRAVGRERRA